MTPEELDLVETDVLVAALHRRCDALLIVMRHLDSKDAGRTFSFVRGDSITVLGLSTLLKRTALRYYKASSGPIGPNDG